MNMAEVEGIKKKLSISTFKYHMTGFGQDIIYSGFNKEIQIVCSDTQEVYHSEVVEMKEFYYDDFLIVAKRFHLRMIEDNMTGFRREFPHCDN